MLWVFLAASLACAKTGNKIAARIAIMAITTSNSMRVNALFFIVLFGSSLIRSGVTGNELPDAGRNDSLNLFQILSICKEDGNFAGDCSTFFGSGARNEGDF